MKKVEFKTPTLTKKQREIIERTENEVMIRIRGLNKQEDNGEPVTIGDGTFWYKGKRYMS